MKRIKKGDLVTLTHNWTGDRFDAPKLGLAITDNDRHHGAFIMVPGSEGTSYGKDQTGEDNTAYYRNESFTRRLGVGDLVQTPYGVFPVTSIALWPHLGPTGRFVVLAEGVRASGVLYSHLAFAEEVKRVRKPKPDKPVAAYKREIGRLQHANEKHKSALRYDQKRVMDAKALIDETIGTEPKRSLLDGIRSLIGALNFAKYREKMANKRAAGFETALSNLKNAREHVLDVVNSTLGMKYVSSKEAVSALSRRYLRQRDTIAQLQEDNRRLLARAVAAETGILKREEEHKEEINTLAPIPVGSFVEIVSVNDLDGPELESTIGFVGRVESFSPNLIGVEGGYLEFLVRLTNGEAWWYRKQDLKVLHNIKPGDVVFDTHERTSHMAGVEVNFVNHDGRVIGKCRACRVRLEFDARSAAMLEKANEVPA